jgi:uncharacterized MAPEG superfamily protein
MQLPTFTLAYWCVLIAAMLPIVCAGIAKSGRFGVPRKQGGYDNVNPRAWLAQQTDWRSRADAAQANSFEALPFFIGAVVIAHQLGADTAWVNALAVIFVLLRVLYVAAYVVGKGGLRSTLWVAAMVVNIGILFVGYR